MKLLIQKTTHISKKVRLLLQERFSSSLPYIPFNEFPNGCCSDSSFILKEIISRRLSVDAKVVSFDKGINGLSDSHAWVEVEGLCVDITIDQFNAESAKSYPAVYVGSGLELHESYRNGEVINLIKPSWLDVVVEDLDKAIFK